jgi:predicted nuclease of restriction endonuclease-like (RecB) superfamily
MFSMKVAPRQRGGLSTRAENALFRRISAILDAARGAVVRSVNTAMVHAYWLIGREIVEHEQHGQRRADYGERILARLAERLRAHHGHGYSATTLKRTRRFYLLYPSGSVLPRAETAKKIGSALLAQSAKKSPAPLAQSGAVAFPPSLSWGHYLVLLHVKTDAARSFYEIEAVREAWSARELERQVASCLYERLARSRNKEAVRALAKQGQVVSAASDLIKDPLVLEFLGLDERGEWRESDLEQAIINRLQEFLLELGKGFCFVARQKRLTLDGDHFFVDLVFYNRLLRCFVLVDLKLGKLTHQDLGQMQMYVNFFDRYQRGEGDAPSVGIVLCSAKNEAMARITLPDRSQVHASQYQVYLPTEKQLRDRLVVERAQVERIARLDVAEASAP